MNQDLFIIAAGQGSRMGGNVPKALIPISDGEPNLTTTLKQIGHKFNRVFVVTNENIQDQWAEYFSAVDLALLKNVVNVPIISGLGDGHAVLAGILAALEKNDVSDDIVICWGDVFIQHAEIVDELLNRKLFQMSASGLIPAIREQNPYVTLLVDDALKCMAADFSKYGEHHQSGFHDQSIFRFKTLALVDALTRLHTSLWKNGRYMSPGGELSLLFVFHYLYNAANAVVVYETDYPTLSFNDRSEVLAIQQDLIRKWKNPK